MVGLNSAIIVMKNVTSYITTEQMCSSVGGVSMTTNTIYSNNKVPVIMAGQGLLNKRKDNNNEISTRLS